ncbi:DNA-binding transcriptional regulator [Xanthomonas campestris pv. campestris]|nr:DNA-binding transcriptional regulator [Xanthomonas campestris pv. campestris]
MKTKIKHNNELSEALHSSASALHKVGAISKATMRDFNERHLAQVPNLKPAEIVRIRTANHVSQPVFARYLNTSESTVEKWETGAKKPSAMALKLLAVVDKRGLEVLA